MIFLKIFRNNIYDILIKSRFYIALLIGVVVFLINAYLIYELSLELGEPICIVDVFIYTISDIWIISLLLLSLILIFSDNNVPTYVLMKTGRLNFILGNTLYIVVVISVYYFVCFLSTIVYINNGIYVSNMWSDPMYIIATQSDYVNSKFLLLGFNIKIMQTMLPFEAFIHSNLLIVLYSALLILLLMFLKYNTSKSLSFIIVIVFHLSYFMLQNTKIIHPLYHAILSNYRIESLGYSYTYLISLNIVLCLLNIKFISKYDFG